MPAGSSTTTGCHRSLPCLGDRDQPAVRPDQRRHDPSTAGCRRTARPKPTSVCSAALSVRPGRCAEQLGRASATGRRATSSGATASGHRRRPRSASAAAPRNGAGTPSRSPRSRASARRYVPLPTVGAGVARSGGVHPAAATWCDLNRHRCQLDRPARAGQRVAPLARHLLGRERRRPLHLRPTTSAASVHHHGAFRPRGPRRASATTAPVPVIGVVADAEARPSATYVFVGRLDEPRQSGRPAQHQHQQPGRERIERAGVPHRSGPELAADHATTSCEVSPPACPRAARPVRSVSSPRLSSASSCVDPRRMLEPPIEHEIAAPGRSGSAAPWRPGRGGTPPRSAALRAPGLRAPRSPCGHHQHPWRAPDRGSPRPGVTVTMPTRGSRTSPRSSASASTARIALADLLRAGVDEPCRPSGLRTPAPAAGVASVRLISSIRNASIRSPTLRSLKFSMPMPHSSPSLTSLTSSLKRLRLTRGRRRRPASRRASPAPWRSAG